MMEIYNTTKSKSKKNKGDIIYEGKQNYLIYKISVEFYVLYRYFSGSFITVHVETGWEILFEGIREHYISMLIIFLVSGICGLVIVYQLRKMIGTVIRRNCFSDVNTKSLKIMEAAAFLITVLFL